MAASTRTLTFTSSAPPTGRTEPSCSTRSNFACASRGRSPISSRNMEPPWARRNNPGESATAPVKAPFLWPNSSDSTSSAGSAAQLTGTKGLSACGLEKWIARAINSLPVPDSPVITTGLLIIAAPLIFWNTSRIASVWPMMFSNWYWPFNSPARRRTSCWVSSKSTVSWRIRSMARMRAVNSSMSKGLPT